NLLVTMTQGSSTFTSAPLALNIAGAVGQNAFLGFTGGTGGASAQQVISNFVYNSAANSVFANNVILSTTTSAIQVAATAGVPIVSMGALTFAVPTSTLNISADASTPANQAYGLTFTGTTLNGATTLNVPSNGTGGG